MKDLKQERLEQLKEATAEGGTEEQRTERTQLFYELHPELWCNPLCSPQEAYGVDTTCYDR